MNSVQRFLLGLLVALGVGGTVANTRAADTMQLEKSFVLDKRGDGQVTVSYRLSASQWTGWKQQYGDRPDMLWRDTKQQLANMALGDFDLKKDEIARTATVRVSFRGGPRLRSDGTSEIGIPKDMKKISESGREWIFNAVSQENSYAPIVNQTIHFTLPAEARNAHISQPGTAFQALVYEIPEKGGRGIGLLLGGLFALMFGAVLAAVSFLPGKTAASGGAPKPSGA
jgi:hypothetical protein